MKGGFKRKFCFFFDQTHTPKGTANHSRKNNILHCVTRPSHRAVLGEVKQETPKGWDATEIVFLNHPRTKGQTKFLPSTFVWERKRHFWCVLFCQLQHYFVFEARCSHLKKQNVFWRGPLKSWCTFTQSSGETQIYLSSVVFLDGHLCDQREIGNGTWSNCRCWGNVYSLLLQDLSTKGNSSGKETLTNTQQRPRFPESSLNILWAASGGISSWV